MAKHLMIAVDWYGAYKSVKEARDAAKPFDWPGLYVLIGKTPDQEESKIQYIGISKSLSGRLNTKHHAIGSEAIEENAIRDVRIWLGEVATAEPSGKKLKATKATLDYAEWLHARFMKLPLNKMKTKHLPTRSVTVLNRWWSSDFERLLGRRPHADWPNLIDYPHHDLPARTVWFGGKQRTFSKAEGYAVPD